MTATRTTRRLMPALLSLAAVALLTGMSAPVLKTTSLGMFDDRVSILAGIGRLADSGAHGLALVILLFSVLLPLSKLGVLLALHRGWTGQGEAPHRWLVLLLGKWSMLDVFVIAIVMGSVQLGLLSEARAAWGIYAFGAGVLLSMIAAGLIPVPDGSRARSRVGHWLDGLSLLLLVAGLLSPLMVLEKAWFWEQEFSLVTALPAFWRAGEFLLPVVLGVFVVALPLWLALSRWQPRWLPGALTSATLEKWSMLEVFVLGLLLVFVKLGHAAEVRPLAGFWLLSGAVVCEGLAAWRHQAQP